MRKFENNKFNSLKIISTSNGKSHTTQRHTVGLNKFPQILPMTIGWILKKACT